MPNRMPKIGIISSIILPPRYENLTELSVQTQPPGCKVAVVSALVAAGQLRQCAGRCRPVHRSRLLESRGVFECPAPATFYSPSPSQLAHDVIARFPGRRSDPGAFAGQAVPRGVRDFAAAL